MLLILISVMRNEDLYDLQHNVYAAEESYMKKNVIVQVEGVALEENTRGFSKDGVFMVPSEEVFKDALGSKYEYDETEGKVIISKHNRKIELTVGSKEAMIDGIAAYMEQEPVKQMMEDGTEQIFVPIEFVAVNLLYQYTIEEISDRKIRVNLEKPKEYKEGNNVFYYSGKMIQTVEYNNKSISLKNTIPGLVFDEQIIIPVDVLEQAPINAKVEELPDSIKIERGGYEIIIEKGSKKALVNGKELEMPTKIRRIATDTVESYMISSEFFFSAIDVVTYKEQLSEEKLIIKKSGGTYLERKFEKLQEEDNSIKKLVVKDKKNKDFITFKCVDTPNVKVSSTKKKIKLIIKNTSVSKDYFAEILDAKYVSEVSVKNTEEDLVIVIKKKKNTPFIYQYGENKVNIYVGMKPTKVAVDCGHGAYTPGKRSPKMPCDIDFEGDGIIDVKKGQSIREHQGNVGVGKYLAKELERCGFSVYKSAFGNEDVSLSNRQKNIKKNKCKYSISIHFNAVGTGRKFNKASGLEIYYHSSSSLAKSSKGLAKVVLNEMIKGTYQINRGVKSQNLALCNTEAMGTDASILVECAFMTNLREAKTMFGNEKYWKESAKEIAKAMCNYTGVEYIEE